MVEARTFETNRATLKEDEQASLEGSLIGVLAWVMGLDGAALHDGFAGMEESLERDRVPREVLHQPCLQLSHGFHECGHPIIVEGHEEQLVTIVLGIRHRNRARLSAAAHPVNHRIPG